MKRHLLVLSAQINCVVSKQFCLLFFALLWFSPLHAQSNPEVEPLPDDYWQGPGVFDAVEQEMLESLGLLGAHTLVKEPLSEDPRCQKPEALSSRAYLDALLDYLRGPTREIYQTILAAAATNEGKLPEPILSELTFLLDTVRERYAEFWKVDESLNVDLHPEYVSLSTCMPQTIEVLENALSLYYAGLIGMEDPGVIEVECVDNDCGKNLVLPSAAAVAVRKAIKSKVNEEEEETTPIPAPVAIPRISLLGVPRPEFIVAMEQLRAAVRIEEARELYAMQRIRPLLNFFNEGTAEQRQAARAYLLKQLLHRFGIPSGMISASLGVLVSTDAIQGFTWRPGSPYHDTIILSERGFALLRQIIESHSKNARGWRYWRWFLSGGGGTLDDLFGTVRIGRLNFIADGSVSTLELDSARARFELVSRVIQTLATNPEVYGVTRQPDLTSVLNNLLNTRTRFDLANPQLPVTEVARSVHQRLMLCDHGATVFDRPVSAEIAHDIAELAWDVTRRIVGPGASETLPDGVAVKQRLVEADRAIRSLLQAGVPRETIVDIVMYARDHQQIIDLWGSRTEAELRALARARGGSTAEWYAYRSRAEVTRAIGRAMDTQLSFRQWAGLTVGSSVGLNAFRLFARDAFTTHHVEEWLPGLGLSLGVVARNVFNAPEEYLVFSTRELSPGVVITIVTLRDLSGAFLMMGADRLATPHVASALQRIAPQRVADWVIRHGVGRALGPVFACVYGWYTGAELAQGATTWQVIWRTSDAVLQGGAMGSIVPGIGTVIGGGTALACAGIGSITSAVTRFFSVRAEGRAFIQRQLITRTLANARLYGFVQGQGILHPITPPVRDYLIEARDTLFYTLLREAGASRVFLEGGIAAAQTVMGSFLAYEAGVPTSTRLRLLREGACRRVFPDQHCQFDLIRTARAQAGEFHGAMTTLYRSAIRWEITNPDAPASVAPIYRSDLEDIDRNFPLRIDETRPPTTAEQPLLDAQEAYLQQHLPTLKTLILWTEAGRNILEGSLTHPGAPRIAGSWLVRKIWIPQIDAQIKAREAMRVGVLDFLGQAWRMLPASDPRRNQARLYSTQLATAFESQADVTLTQMQAIGRFIDTLASEIENPADAVLRSQLAYQPESTHFASLSREQRLVAVIAGSPRRIGGSENLNPGWISLGLIDGYQLSVTPYATGAYVRRQREGRTEIRFVEIPLELMQVLRSLPQYGTGPQTAFEHSLQDASVRVAGERMFRYLRDQITIIDDPGPVPRRWEDPAEVFTAPAALQAFLNRPAYGGAYDRIRMELTHHHVLALELSYSHYFFDQREGYPMGEALGQLSFEWSEWAPHYPDPRFLMEQFLGLLRCKLREIAARTTPPTPIGLGHISEARLALEQHRFAIQGSGGMPIQCP